MVIYMKDFTLLRCDEEPASAACTERLRQGTCPSTARECVSTKFDADLHNRDLPKFYDAQHS